MPADPLTVLSPDSRNFRPFGKIIEYPNKESRGRSRNLWRIVHTENAKTGWRVAYLVLRDKTIGRLECHPYSDETFEPVRGRALMFISASRQLGEIRCFKIDKPLIVHKGVWHGLVAVDDEAEIKITENAKVKCVYWPFGFRVRTAANFLKRV